MLSVFQSKRLSLWVVLLILSACHKKLPPDLQPVRTVEIQTEDGWTLPLIHHGGTGPAVLLMHGMSANHYNWDYRSEVSPIPGLLERGYSVWVGSLRGDIGTTAPEGKRSSHITFDDHALYDAPAMIRGVLEQTGQPDLMWIGHSMGGMLLYTSAIEHHSEIRAGIAVASPATFQSRRKNYDSLKNFGFMVAARRGRVPMRALSHLGLARARPILRQLGNPDNLDPRIMAGAADAILENLPRATVRQARQWIRARELTRLDGQPWLVRAPDTRVPLLVLGAADDHIAAERDVAHACRIFADCRYILLGQATGFSVDYGHIDPVFGLSAPAEVYPLLFTFLEEHRPDRQPR